MSSDRIRVRSQKITHRSGKHAKKMTFSQKFFWMGQHQIENSQNGPAQIRNSWNGPAHTGNSWNGPAQIGNSRNGLAQFRISRLAHFGNSCFGLAHFRNSWFGLAHFGKSLFGLAHFGNSQFGIAHFGNFWFGAGLLKKLLRKCCFFRIFSTHSVSFWPLTFLYLDGMHILQKDLFKTFIHAWNRNLNILLPPVWSRHRLLNKWKSKYR